MKAEIQPFRRLNLTVSMWLEAFSIIIELSHKILWEEFRIKTNHKGRPRIAAFQYYSSKDHGRGCLQSILSYSTNLVSTIPGRVQIQNRTK